MRRVRTEELESGMIIARSVLGSDGRMLLSKNTVLSDVYIHKLSELGLGSLYIKDFLADDEIPEIVSTKVMISVSTNLKSALRAFVNRRTLDLDLLRKSVSFLLEDVLSSRNLLIQLEDIRAYNDYLMFHSINVTVLSLMVGISMEFTESSLMDLGLGALLHDIGMISIDPGILSKPGGLNETENAKIQQHPEVGFNILRAYREVSTMAAHVAYQHHERMDGNGYPRQLPARQILDFARIAAIADTFDAIISDRPYRKGYSLEEGVIVLRKLAGTYFDPEIVDVLASHVAIYPVGSLLSLNTGHIAVVTSTTRHHASQPVISVICDTNRQFIPPFSIDLSCTPDVRIARKLNNEEADDIRSRIQATQPSG